MARKMSKGIWGWRRWLGIPIAALAATFVVLIVDKPVDAASSLSVEAERMSGSGKVFFDRSASNDRARLFDKNRSASRQFTGSVEKVTVRARGDRCGRAPRMVVKVDGKTVMSRLVRAEKKWVYYRRDVDISGGEHKVKTAFTNNRETRRCDHSLHVDKISIMKASRKTSPSEPTPSPDDAVDKPTCEGSLQAMVDAADPGATVEVPGEVEGGCVYRETVTITKPLTLKAGAGAEIRGSDVWTDWTKKGAYWVKGTVPTFSVEGVCQAGTSRCQWPEQVFLDGKPLTQVASDPASGQFAVDDSRRVVLADDPTGHTVEVTVRRQWIVGKSGGVTIEGFTMKHAASDSKNGLAAFSNGGKSNWTLSHSDLSYAHGTLASLWGLDTTGLRFVDNELHHAGQKAIGGWGTSGLLISSNRIHDNNTEAFSQNWEAGAMKLARVTNAVVSDNEIYNNLGNGVWFDVSCFGGTIEGNVVHHNTRNGIHYEVSDGGPAAAKIYGNTVYENGWTNDGASYRAGIQVTASQDVEIYGNTLAWNANGMRVVGQARGPDKPWYPVRNVSIHNNTILQHAYGKTSYALGWLDQWDGSIFDATSNNRGYNDSYYYSTAESKAARYAWQGNYSKLSMFNNTPGEENGQYLSETEKGQVVSSSGVPASPEVH